MTDSKEGMTAWDSLNLARLIERSLADEPIVRTIEIVPQRFAVEVEIPGLETLRFDSPRAWSRWLEDAIRETLSRRGETGLPMGMALWDALDLEKAIRRSLANDAVTRTTQVLTDLFVVEVIFPGPNPVRFHSFKEWRNWLQAQESCGVSE